MLIKRIRAFAGVLDKAKTAELRPILTLDFILNHTIRKRIFDFGRICELELDADVANYSRDPLVVMLANNIEH